MHQHIIFQQNWAICGSVIDDLANVPLHFSRSPIPMVTAQTDLRRTEINHRYKLVLDFRYLGQIFRIGTAHYAEGLWRMRRHGPVIAHCTDSEDFPYLVPLAISRNSPRWLFYTLY